jgi:hypothetical protein
VEPRQLIRSGITASAIVHLSFLMLVIFFSEVRPFGAVKVESIAVDLVAPEEAAEKKPQPEPDPVPETKPSNSFDLPASATASEPPSSASDPPSSSAPAAGAEPAAPQQAAAPSRLEAAPSTPSLASPAPVAPSQPQLPLPSASPAVTSPSTVYVPAQPDISVKYHVMLGLPQNRPGDGFDAMANRPADIAADLITEFRNHLKTCATLPKSVVPSDKVTIKLRVLMTPDGRLAAEPILIEASASAKGPILMQTAIQALQACQPYAMLPAARYGEWKKLDLSFTPRDFPGG